MIFLEDTPEALQVFRALRSMMELPPSDAPMAELILEQWKALAALYGCGVPLVTEVSGHELTASLGLIELASQARRA